MRRLSILSSALWIASCATPRTAPEAARPAPSKPTPAHVQVHGSGDEIVVTVGDRAERLRYVEESRVEGEFNYPDVKAKILAAGGEPILEVHCHDSFDDCGTGTEDLTCPVANSQLDFEQLRALHLRLGGQISPLEMVEAIGAATPISACMARVNETDPDLVWLTIEGSFDAPAEAIDHAYTHITAAIELWPADAKGAISEVDRCRAKLAEQSVPPAVTFAISYGVEQLRHVAAADYFVPIVGPGGRVVPGAGELQKVHWGFVAALQEWQDGEPFPRPNDALLVEATREALPNSVAQHLNEGQLDAIYTAGAGHVAHLMLSDTDDVWLFVLPDGRVLHRMHFSSSDTDDDDIWSRPRR